MQEFGIGSGAVSSLEYEISDGVRVALNNQLADVSRVMGGSNVLLYYSAGAGGAALCGHDIDRFLKATEHMAQGSRLAFIMQTPGGIIEVAARIIEEMHRKFKHVTALVPGFAYSSGTIMALSCHRLLMSEIGRLSPTDPQQPLGSVPIREVVVAHRDDVAGNACACPLHELVNKWSRDLPGIYARELDLQRGLLAMPGREACEVAKLLAFFCEDRGKAHNHQIYCRDLAGLPLQVGIMEKPLNDAVRDAINSLGAYTEKQRIGTFRTFFPFSAI